MYKVRTVSKIASGVQVKPRVTKTNLAFNRNGMATTTKIRAISSTKELKLSTKINNDLPVTQRGGGGSTNIPEYVISKFDAVVRICSRTQKKFVF